MVYRWDFIAVIAIGHPDSGAKTKKNVRKINIKSKM